MVENDILYFRACHKAGLVKEPFLEIGSAIVEHSLVNNLCRVAQELGLSKTFGTDLEAGPGVDFTADFSLPPDQFKAGWTHGQFQTVAIFNVLEHTYDPITILTNALSCVAPGGTLCVAAPGSWALHDYPKDYVRLLPHWFEEFGQRNGLKIYRDHFCYLSDFGLIPVDQLNIKGQYQFPTYINSTRRSTPFRYWRSRILHRLFNTYGRSHFFPQATIGCVYQVSPA